MVKSEPKRRKKKSKEVEIVENCDQCGKALNRTCARNMNSAVMAIANGIEVLKIKTDGSIVDDSYFMRRDGDIKFFCGKECRQGFVNRK